MAIASGSGFIGGTNAAPEIAKFPMGATSRAGNGFITGSTGQTLSADSPEVIRIVSPSTAINQDLPTTGVKAGRIFRLEVKGATETNYIALRSSGGNEIDRIGGNGFIEVEALVDSPTTAAHWNIVFLFEETANISGTTSGAVVANFNSRLKREKSNLHDNVFFTGYFSHAATNATAVNQIVVPVSYLPTRFRPAAARFSPTTIVLNNTLSAGMAIINANGSIEFRRYDAANFSGTSGITDSINAYATISWLT